MAKYELFASFLEKVNKPLRRLKQHVFIFYLNPGKHTIIIKQHTKFLESSYCITYCTKQYDYLLNLRYDIYNTYKIIRLKILLTFILNNEQQNERSMHIKIKRQENKKGINNYIGVSTHFFSKKLFLLIFFSVSYLILSFDCSP